MYGLHFFYLLEGYKVKDLFPVTLRIYHGIHILTKVDPGGTGGTCPPLASLIIYSFLNNFVIFATLVHLREALSYYVGLPLKVSFRSLQVYTTVFYPVFSKANNHELFSCAPPPL